jgi:hypothetical protein
MATDFNNNALSSQGGFKPNPVDTPIDIRTRVETEADIVNIPKPYIGMVIFVKDTGKRFEVVSLKDAGTGMSIVKNGAVNEYKEIAMHEHNNKTALDAIDYDNVLNWKSAYNHSQSVHAPADAQKNVQADWSIDDQNSDAFIANKPDFSMFPLRDELDEVEEMFDNKSFKYLTQAEYNALSDDEKNNEAVVYCITDAEPPVQNVAALASSADLATVINKVNELISVLRAAKIMK